MRARMHETHYRASRVCRVLGNPTAYQIVNLLEDRRLRPSDIARELGISLTLTSSTLRLLRNIDLLRYETRGKDKIYWLKEDKVRGICRQLERFVGRIRHKKY